MQRSSVLVALALALCALMAQGAAASDLLGGRRALAQATTTCPALTQAMLDSIGSKLRIECLNDGVKGCTGKRTSGACINDCVYRAKRSCPTREQVLGMFDKWNAALLTLDSNKVADRYTPNAVLLPTLSNTPRNNRAEIIAYFNDFLLKKPVGEFQTIAGGSPNFYILADGVVALAGIAKFTLTEKDGSKSEVFVRKTFVFEQKGRDWLIAEHHSSLMPESGPAPTADEVIGMFNTWNAALQTLDPNKVADRYTKDAVLLPTLSNTPRNTRAEIVAYFVSFLQNKPVGEFQTIAGSSPNVKILAPGVVSLSGVAKFTLTDKDGAKSDVFVRKTFVFQKVGADWLIAEHQSSLMPETEAQPTAEEVVGFFNTWNAALQTLDAEKVADRYTKDAVLLPTLSNTPRNTRAEIVAYFVSFLQNKPVGEFQTIAGGSPNVKNLAPGVVSLSGVAKFVLTNKDTGAKSDVFVRKTFVFQKVGADWLIAEHQSSVMPEPM